MFIFILTVLLSDPNTEGMMIVGFMNQHTSMSTCEQALQRVGEGMLKHTKEDKDFKPSPLKCLQIKADIPEGKKES